MKVIMTKGLPGSGKSTWARKLKGFKRINKDDLRLMLDDSKWSRKNEEFILLMRDTMALSALQKGWNVVIDDTNLAPKHEAHLRELAKTAGADFEIMDFTYVPIEQCIKQDLLRFNSVGEKVIKQMYKDFLKPKHLMVTTNPDLPTAIICDLDGTLALFGDANPYDRDFLQDKVNEAVKNILLSSIQEKEGPTRIILVSGRSDKFLEQTHEWLKRNFLAYNRLYMRKDGDSRKDSIVKQEIYETYIKDKFNVLFVLDDRDQVVELWRSLGLTCLQVAEGDF